MEKEKKIFVIPNEKELKPADKQKGNEDKKVDEDQIFRPQTEPNPQIPDPPVPNRAHTPI